MARKGWHGESRRHSEAARKDTGKFRAWLRWKGYNDNLSIYTKSKKGELHREYLKSKEEFP